MVYGPGAIMRRFIVFAAGVALFAAAGSTGQAQPAAAGGHPDIRLFFQAIHDDGDVADAALEQIAARWRNGYAGIIWDLVRFMQPPRRPAAPAFRRRSDESRRRRPAGMDTAGTPEHPGVAAADAVSRAADRAALPRGHPAGAPVDLGPAVRSASGLRLLQGAVVRPDGSPFRGLLSAPGVLDHPVGRDRLGRRGRQRYSAAGVPRAPAGRRGGLPRRRPRGVRGRGPGARPAPIRNGSWPGTRWRSIAWAASS